MPWIEYIRNNFLLKIFSLALAVLIYLAVQSHLHPESRIQINLFRNTKSLEFTLPVKLLISAGPSQTYKISPPEVKVTVSFDPTVVQKLDQTKIQVFARVDDVRGPMMSDFPLETKLPRDVTLESIKPDRVSIETTGQSSGFMVFPWSPMN